MSTMHLHQSIGYPYPGLRPFEQDEAPIFFGRGTEIERMLANLEDYRFLAVVGASGSGKSSLVRAGLLPALENGYLTGAEVDWRFVVMRPGEVPFARLASAINTVTTTASEETDPNVVAYTEATLRSGPLGLIEATRVAGIQPNTCTLVLVDQFEEIFRFRRRERSFNVSDNGGESTRTYLERNEAAAFVNLLLATVKQTDCPIYVVITMRSDFLGDCDIFHGLPEAIDDSQFLTPRMTREPLRDAIVGPLDYLGQSVDPTLVNQILNDVGPAPDQLPLMQHALMRTWETATRRTEDRESSQVAILPADYKAVGGLDKALSNHADEVYEKLGDDQKRRVAEVMFRRLCDRGAEARLTRRLATVAEVAAVADVSPDTVVEVAEPFLRPGRTFVTASPRGSLGPDSTLDISHEALIRQWVRFRRWLLHEEESAAFYRRLSDTATAWKQGRAGFWAKLDLEMAQNWKTLQKPNDAWAKRYGGGLAVALEFLDASAKEQEELQRREEERTRSARRVKFMQVAVVFALLIVAVLGSFYAIAIRNERRARNAETVANQAQSRTRRSAYNAQLARVHDNWRNNPELAFSLLSRRCPEDLRDFTWALFDVLSGKSLIQKYSYLSREELDQYRKDLDRLQAPPPPWNKIEEAPYGHQDAVYSLAYSETKKLLASAGLDQEIWLWVWDTTTMDSVKPVARLSPGAGPFYSVVFSQDGNTLAWAGQDGTIHLWDTRKIGESIESDRPVEYRPDGQSLGSGLESINQGEWRIAPLTTRKLEGSPSRVMSLAFAPDGQTLASAGDDTVIRLWNVQTESEKNEKRLQGHTSWVSCVTFSPDGNILASASHDTTVKLWDLNSGSELSELDGHDTPVLSISFAPDGKTLASGGDDGKIRIWNLQSGSELTRAPLKGHTGSVRSVAFSRDGQTLASAGDYSTVRLWDATSWQERAQLRRHSGIVYALAFMEDSKQLAAASGDGTIKLWDATVGVRMDSRQLDGGPLVAFAPETDVLAWTTAANTIKLLDGGTGGELELEGHTQAISCLEFSRSGQMLASCGEDGTIRLWSIDGSSVELVRTPEFVTSFLRFSPDGNTLATAGSDKTVKLWNVQSLKVIKLEGHTAGVNCVDFAPDGTLASCGNDGTIRFWNTARPDVKIERLLNCVRVHEDSVLFVRFSPDGKKLATAGNDRTVKLWDSEFLLKHASAEIPDSEAVKLEGHSGAVTSLVFFQDENMSDQNGKSTADEDDEFTTKITLASGSMDGFIRLWDPILGDYRGTLTGHTAAIRSIAFRYDGKVLASAGDDGTVRRWDSTANE